MPELSWRLRGGWGGSIAAKQHVQSGLDLQRVRISRTRAMAQFTDKKYGDAQGMQLQGLTVNHDGRVETLGQAGNGACAHQRNAHALRKTEQQIALNFQHEGKVCTVLRDRVGVDVKTGHGLMG